MNMNLKLTNKNGITLKTANKFISQDINIIVDEDLIGIDTADATAVSCDIGKNKIAYAKNQKLVGSLETWTGEHSALLATGIYPKGLKKITTVDSIDVTTYATARIVDPDLIAENVIEGVSILNVSGSCKPYEAPELQEKETLVNGEVLPDDGYVGLSKAIVNTPTVKKLLDATKTCDSFFSKAQITYLDLNNCLKYDDTSNVTSMRNMFENCSSLTTIPLLDTSNVTNMSYMFQRCEGLTTIPQLDTSNVTNMSGMFFYCSELQSVPLLDTTNVIYMGCMFQDCKNLTSIPLLDTSNVTDMSSMFYQASSLTTIPQLNTSKVTSMSGMFATTSITEIPQLDTSNVTNMHNMFCQATRLTTIPQLNTSNVTDMSLMFSSCWNLTSIPQLDTSKVTDMSHMFHNCRYLTTIPQLDTSKVTSMDNMFNYCTKLEKIDLTYYGLSNNNSQIFNDCYSLKELVIRSFGVNYAIASNAFTDCYHLTGTINETYNPNGDKDCYIYVPRDIVDTLRSTAGWSDHASQIRALEDYTVDGTTQGDIDPNKIN